MSLPGRPKGEYRSAKHEGDPMSLPGRPKGEYRSAKHEGEPMAERLVGLPMVVARSTRLVVLGSFPGAASLQAQQYYAHPRNHFWPILSALWGVDLPGMPYRQRLAEVCRRGLGFWDVYASCRREGSLDSAIEAAEPNDLSALLRRAPGLRAIAHNGGESARSMAVTAALGVPVHRLPSTSPANASWSFERKRAAWQEVFESAGLL
jgi:hypoxanthine-DNA glycosylase